MNVSASSPAVEETKHTIVSKIDSRWRWSWMLPALILMVSVLLQGRSWWQETPKNQEPHLAPVIPVDLPGWKSHDIPLGPTEFASSAAEKILNFDEVV